MTSQQKHLVCASSTGWGHVRSIVQVAMRIKSLVPDLLVTLLGAPAAAPRLVEELDRQKHLSEASRNNMQVITVEPLEALTDMPDDGNAKGLNKALKGLLECQLGKWPVVPSVVIFDAFLMGTPEILRSLAHQGLPRVHGLFFSGSSDITIARGTIAKEHGGTFSRLEEYRQEYIDQGMNDKDALEYAYACKHDRLIGGPDLPPMYEYECTDATDPQWHTRIVDAPIVKFVMAMSDVRKAADGCITFGVPEIEPESTKALQHALSSQLYSVGPLMDEAAWESNNPRHRTEYDADERKVINFLDDMEKRYGKRSLAFVSLGTLHWPVKRPELMDYLFDTLLETHPDLPFIFAAAWPGGGATDEMLAKIEKSGRALYVKWVPQYTVLQHDVVRFFISHCGNGSYNESISAELPIIAFPFGGDQAFNAQLLSKVHKFGIQLHQMNTGMDGKRLGHGEIVVGTEEAIKKELTAAIAAMRDGPRYAEFKTNVKKLKSIIQGSLKEGKAKESVDKLIRTYLS